MLGVHINTVLDFKEHLAHITKDVRLVAKALAKRNLSPPYKTPIIENLLKSKYHATQLGVFTDPKHTEQDRILKKATNLATSKKHKQSLKKNCRCSRLEQWKDRGTEGGGKKKRIKLRNKINERGP